jgi:hypothetical protein
MKEILTANGWKFFHRCNCGGSLREHYHNENFKGYEIRIRPSRSTFYILNKGVYAVNPSHGYKLESEMKKLKFIS